MNAMIPLYVHTTNFIAYRAETVKDRLKDRGASGAEYVGLIILAGAIIGGIYWAFDKVGWKAELLKAFNAIFRTKATEG